MSGDIRRRTLLFGTAAAFTATASGRSYRAVVIGHTGRGNYGHDWDSSLRGYPNIEVVAVADPDASGRSRARVSSGAAREYEDYREMLRKEKPDLAAICPRTLDQRLPMFTASVEAGAHILMEKPFARDLIEADAMIALAEKHKRKVQVGHTARPTPVTIRARNMLRDGAIGKFLEMRARGKEDRRAGGEDMMVLGTHLFDLMRFFAGDPRWCFAHVTAAGAEVDSRHAREATEALGPVAGDDIAAMYYFESGIHGYFGSRPSGANTGDRFGLTLLGSRGAIFVPTTTVPGSPPHVLYSPSWASGAWELIEPRPEERLVERGAANTLMVRDLLEAIEKDRAPVCSAHDARWTIEMVMAVYQSQRSGARVSFPLKDRKHPLGG